MRWRWRWRFGFGLGLAIRPGLEWGRYGVGGLATARRGGAVGDQSRRPVVAAAACLTLLLSVAAGVNDAVIMFGILKKTLGGDTVAGRKCVAGHGKVFVQHLLNRSPDLGFRTVAFNVNRFGRRMAPAIVAGTSPSGIGTVFHLTRCSLAGFLPPASAYPRTALMNRMAKIHYPFGFSPGKGAS